MSDLRAVMALLRFINQCPRSNGTIDAQIPQHLLDAAAEEMGERMLARMIEEHGIDAVRVQVYQRSSEP